MVDGLQFANQQASKSPPERDRLCVCRMVGIDKEEVRREVPAATKARIRDEVVELVEQPEKAVSWVRRCVQRRFVPLEIFLRGAVQDSTDEAVLSAEVLIQGPAGNA
jgi:hypothetical protein